MIIKTIVKPFYPEKESKLGGVRLSFFSRLLTEQYIYTKLYKN